MEISQEKRKVLVEQLGQVMDDWIEDVMSESPKSERHVVIGYASDQIEKLVTEVADHTEYVENVRNAFSKKPDKKPEIFKKASGAWNGDLD